MNRRRQIKTKMRNLTLLFAGCTTLAVFVVTVTVVIVMSLSDQETIDTWFNEHAPPEPAAGLLFRPDFETIYGPVSAGTAFPAWDAAAGEAVLLSAHHLLGEAGGLDRELRWDEVASAVTSVSLEPMTSQEPPPKVGAARTIPNAGAMENGRASGDMLAFRLPDHPQSRSLPLSKKAPYPDDQVWLYAELGNEDTVGLHEGRVIRNSHKFLEFRFLESGISLRATSGAPILNAAGKVVGVHVGGVTYQDELLGYAVPLSAVRENLAKAQKPAP